MASSHATHPAHDQGFLTLPLPNPTLFLETTLTSPRTPLLSAHGRFEQRQSAFPPNFFGKIKHYPLKKRWTPFPLLPARPASPATPIPCLSPVHSGYRCPVGPRSHRQGSPSREIRSPPFGIEAPYERQCTWDSCHQLVATNCGGCCLPCTTCSGCVRVRAGSPVKCGILKLEHLQDILGKDAGVYFFTPGTSEAQPPRLWS